MKNEKMDKIGGVVYSILFFRKKNRFGLNKGLLVGGMLKSAKRERRKKNRTSWYGQGNKGIRFIIEIRLKKYGKGYDQTSIQGREEER